MKKYNLVNQHLKEGQKITIVSQGAVGGMGAIQIKYLGCKPAPRYQNCPDTEIGVSIFYIPKGKRKRRCSTTDADTPLIVYDGWHDIDTFKLLYKQIGDIAESRYDMHSNQYFHDLLALKPDDVILSDIPSSKETEC